MSDTLEIVYSGADANFKEAVRNANTLLASGNLMTLIRERKRSFFNTTRTCNDIADRIENCDAEVAVKFESWPMNRITKTWVNATVRALKRDIIFYNDLRMNRSVSQITNTLVHEAVHIVDYFHDKNNDADFTHDGNEPASKNDDAAPNWIGNRAQDLVPMLNDHEGNDNAKLIDLISMDVVRGYVTNRDWHGEENAICPVEELSDDPRP